MENNYPKISVIVPVYNAEKYLSQCIDSILRQDFTDFELLLIDDGSKDNSGFICDEYAQKDQRVKVFHKKNGGVSSARNLGIDNAQGEYIAFIDSDDYVDHNYLSILTNAPIADLIITGYKEFGSGTNSSDNFKLYNDSIYTATHFSECLSVTLNDATMRAPWDKLFRRNIIKENSIYFDPLISYAEDAVFVHTYLLYCHSIAFKSGTPYHYRIESNTSLLKYGMSSDKYLYTLHTTSQTYKKVTQHFGFTCPEWYNSNTKLMLMQYFRGVSREKFTLKGYFKYKKTMKSACPSEISFSDKLYIVTYKLLKKKFYFLSFFILKYIYPLKLYSHKFYK